MLKVISSNIAVLIAGKINLTFSHGQSYAERCHNGEGNEPTIPDRENYTHSNLRFSLLEGTVLWAVG